MKALLATIVTALLVGCAAGTDFSLDNAAKVQAGMTKAEVVALMGKPMHQTSRVGDEVWTWAHVNMMSGQSRTATIVFVGGVVQAQPGTGKPVQ